MWSAPRIEGRALQEIPKIERIPYLGHEFQANCRLNIYQLPLVSVRLRCAALKNLLCLSPALKLLTLCLAKSHASLGTGEMEFMGCYNV
jgi:hypothetical protein